MLRTLLALAVVAALAVGCAPKREPYYPRRDRRDHRHYRATDEAAKAPAKDDAKAKADDEPDDGGTPMPDVSDDKPTPPADDTSKQMLDVLKGISDKLDKQPQTIHHEFEQFAKAMDVGPPAKAPAAPPAAVEPTEPVPQRVKTEAAPEQPSGFHQDDDRSYGTYTGVVVKMDLAGTRRVNGRLEGGRCIPCRQAWNELASECNHGWTMGDGPQYNFWIKQATLRPGTIDPTWEKVENGRVTETHRGNQWLNGNILTAFRWHPKWEGSRQPRGMDPDFPPKAPGTDEDWPDSRRPSEPVRNRGADPLSAMDHLPGSTPLEQWQAFNQIAGYSGEREPASDPNGNRPLNFMGRWVEANSSGYVGVDERWHNWGDAITGIATYATAAASREAGSRARGSSYGYSGASYPSANCSQPTIQYAAPSCSQPANYGYQQGIQMQSYQPQWSQPMSSYGGGGGHMVCGQFGCQWVP
jgi:hypothetical protein